MSDGRDNVDDRLASRFDNDEETDDGESQNAPSSMNAQKAKTVGNVKDEWNARTIYLSDELEGELSKLFKRLDLKLDDEMSSFRKTRHFYPLLVTVGKERLESMEGEELIEKLERIDPDLQEYLD